MPTCGECIYAEDPSPTLIRCRLKGIFRYLDDPACMEFKPAEKRKDSSQDIDAGTSGGERAISDDLLIRKAKPEDVDVILQITAEAFKDYTVYHLLKKRHGVKFGGRSWSEWKKRELKNFCESSLDRVYVAELNGRVVGYMTYTLDRERRIGEVCNNAVSPRYQRRGIATSLLRRVLETFRQEGMKFAYVKTLEHDMPARRLYEKIGFKELCRSIHYSMRL